MFRSKKAEDADTENPNRSSGAFGVNQDTSMSAEEAPMSGQMSAPGRNQGTYDTDKTGEGRMPGRISGREDSAFGAPNVTSEMQSSYGEKLQTSGVPGLTNSSAMGGLGSGMQNVGSTVEAYGSKVGSTMDTLGGKVDNLGSSGLDSLGSKLGTTGASGEMPGMAGGRVSGGRGSGGRMPGNEEDVQGTGVGSTPYGTGRVSDEDL